MGVASRAGAERSVARTARYWRVACMNIARLRKQLLSWYGANARDLPWRQTREPYAIWLSEVMLQQTRVVAVIPYYEKFLTQFPTVESAAEAQYRIAATSRMLCE